MTKIFTLTVSMLFLLSISLFAGESFNFNGNGGRSAGMGNAFTGVADDATAMSWNSAGLTQLYSMEASVVARMGFGSYNLDWSDAPEVDYSSKFQLNFLSFAVPFQLGRFGVVAGIAYRNMYDFNQELKYTLNEYSSTETSEGGINAITAAAGIKFNNIVSAGFAANFYTGDYQYKETSNIPGYNDFTGDKTDFSGVGFDIGVLIKPNEKFSIGANLNLPNTLKAETGTEEDELDVPFFFSIGGAFRATDQLLFAIDYHSRPWSNSEDYENSENPDSYDLNSFHIGMEYLITAGNSVMPIRLGFQTNPQFNWTDKNGDQVVGNIFSVGTGLIMGNFILDGAISYEPLSVEYTDGTINQNIFSVTIAGIIHFGE